MSFYRVKLEHFMNILVYLQPYFKTLRYEKKKKKKNSKTYIFVVRKTQCRLSFIGLSTSWFGSGLCLTWTWPAHIGWQKERPIADLH